jgi:LmbE family N-acetylglucosaminyl deacetylase
MNKKKVLVVVAHPDDEVLGCGGTIAKHKDIGDEVTVLIMADGVNSRDEKFKSESVDERRSCAQQANSILKVDDLIFLSFPDNEMDTVPLLEVIKSIENIMIESRPDVIYTHSLSDLNIDHCVVHNASITACRALPGQSVNQLLFFEVPSSTEWRNSSSNNIFNPNWFSDISDTLDVKLEALSAYEKELHEFPHPRSLIAVECLAKWRGACSGVLAAEAFELGRKIV